MHHTRAGRGFTILELILTLVLISVVAAFAVQSYFDRGEVTLESASVLLARDLRTAQNRSAYLGEPVRIEFFDDGDGYRAVAPDGEVIHNPCTDEAFVRRYSVDGVFEGVKILAVDFEAGRVVEYDSHGQVRSGGTIMLAFGGDRREIEIEPRSGRISIIGSTSAWSDLGF
jgi:prepilin-type N-terminal cleavage/methylation domain-containing protein